MEATANHYGVEFVPVLNADTGYIFDMDDDACMPRCCGASVLSFRTMKFVAGVTARGAQARHRVSSPSATVR